MTRGQDPQYRPGARPTAVNEYVPLSTDPRRREANCRDANGLVKRLLLQKLEKSRVALSHRNEAIMRLADFILANLEPILVEWEAFARSINPSENMDVLTLRDHAKEILLATVRDMRSVQSVAERLDKSHGHKDGDESGPLNGASELHAISRLGSGFDLNELVSEFGIPCMAGQRAANLA